MNSISSPFFNLFLEQRERARSSREVTNYMGADATVYDEIDPSVTTDILFSSNSIM